MLAQLKEMLKNIDISKVRSHLNRESFKGFARSSVRSVIPRRSNLFRTTLLAVSGLVVGLVLLFPYEIIVGDIIQSTADKNNINLQYSDLRVSIRRLEMEGITVGAANAKPYKVNSLVVKYSPLSAITRKVKVIISDQNTRLVATVTPKRINAKGVLDLADVARIVPNSPIGMKASGTVDLSLSYNLESGDGKAKARSDKMSISASNFPLSLEKVRFDTTIVANNADIKLSTKDAFNINMNGNISINPQNVGTSMLNLRGGVLFFGQEQTFTIGGTVNSPTPNLGS